MEESQLPPVDEESPVEQASKEKDANDYSRFKDIADSDDEEDSKKEEVKISIDMALKQACALKDEGNYCFKNNELKNAKDKYAAGVLLFKDFKEKKVSAGELTQTQYDEMSLLLVSLYGNLAMIMIKEENWTKALTLSNDVLKFDPNNTKAIFRRVISLFRSFQLDEAKFAFNKCLEIDPSNSAAKKELSDVLKALKEHQKKEKLAFASIFDKSLYKDKEVEKAEKIRKELLAKEKLQDEWTKSKLSRREKGLEEQTFDEWKKEKDDLKKKEEEEQKEKKKDYLNNRKEEKKDYDKKYRELNKDIINERQRQNYKLNDDEWKQKRNEKVKEYRR
jgi:hypothetical protein